MVINLKKKEKVHNLNDIINRKKIMIETQREPNIKRACHAANRLQDLNTISSGLEKCQKSLNDYLDSKRNAFPRFFFISDDELLSILGSSDPTCVQEHMIKMFDNIASLRLVKSTTATGGASTATAGQATIQQQQQQEAGNVTQALAMISAEGEVMDFKQPVLAEGRVEDWMTRVLAEMRRTNRLITKEAIYYYRYQKARVRWMYDYQGMVVLATNQVWWTWEVEDVFKKVQKGNKMAMKNYSKQLHQQLEEVVVEVLKCSFILKLIFFLMVFRKCFFLQHLVF